MSEQTLIMVAGRPCKPWTGSDKDQLAQLVSIGMSVKDIASAMGRSRNSIYESIARFRVHQPKATPVHSSVVLRDVAEETGVSVEEITGQSKRRRVAYARQQAMYALSVRTRLSTVRIGQLLGGRDHSTVCWGRQRHLMRTAGAAE